MKVVCFFISIFLSACGGIPPPDELLAAEAEYNQAQIIGGSTKGRCDNPTDLLVFRADNHDFAERWNEHSGLNGLDVDALHAEFPTTSMECINCVGHYTRCSVNRCGLGICDPIFGYGPKHLKCRECTHNACGAAMIKCSGLLPEEWPDFDRGQIR